MLKSRLITIALLALSSAHVRAESFIGKVVGVSDGDTITVLHDLTPEKIRLNGIDCPEKKQDFGQRAKQFTSALVFAKQVKVTYQKRERYGRILGNVSIQGKDLSEELVRAGMAWHYRQYSKDAHLQELEDEAFEARRGLWSMPDPTPPWQFRKERKRK